MYYTAIRLSLGHKVAGEIEEVAVERTAVLVKIPGQSTNSFLTLGFSIGI